ncbi:tetraspanin [Echinococcus multilocularis]|uniref:Tetraspanin n=1 Tax=Echinococcus multilocularis TaxID=6211 RepID=A0A068XW66_ECHMU|nr:tetraspanin [Echinococcus multilocularis]
MYCFLGCVRCVLALLNFILFVIFAAIGVLGLLLKFHYSFATTLLEKVASQLPENVLGEAVIFLQYYGTSLALVLIMVGFLVSLTALLGIFALYCKHSCIGYTYMALLIILIILELVLIICLLAFPQKLYGTIFAVLNCSFVHLRTNDSLSGPILGLWGVVGGASGNFCCGLHGPSDFDGMPPGVTYPPPCCRLNITMMKGPPHDQICNKTEAERLSVGGCKSQIEDFLGSYKGYLLWIACSITVYKVLVLIVVCCLYKWYIWH